MKNKSPEKLGQTPDRNDREITGTKLTIPGDTVHGLRTHYENYFLLNVYRGRIVQKNIICFTMCPLHISIQQCHSQTCIEGEL